jgi:hypothetical protein
MDRARVTIAASTTVLVSLLVWFVFAYSQYLTSEGVYKGVIRFGFETSTFTLCGDETWWVASSDDQRLYTGYRAIAESSHAPVYVEVKATISEKGSYGHMGAFPREMHVYDLVKMSAEFPEECRFVSR